jgi:hypothetical protein
MLSQQTAAKSSSQVIRTTDALPPILRKDGGQSLKIFKLSHHLRNFVLTPKTALTQDEPSILNNLLRCLVRSVSKKPRDRDLRGGGVRWQIIARQSHVNFREQEYTAIK